MGVCSRACPRWAGLPRDPTMKTVFFALASVALILFFYWQWHVSPEVNPHLKRIPLQGATLRMWEPGLVLPKTGTLPTPSASALPQPATKSRPPANPPKVGPAAIHPPKAGSTPHPVAAPVSIPPVCRLIGWFPSRRVGREYARHWHFQHFRFERHARILRLYRLYLLARHPPTQKRVLARLEAAHLHAFYLMNKPTDPKGYSVGVYDALSAAFQRRAQLLRLGFRPHLEIMTHRQTRVWIAVRTERTPTAVQLDWRQTRLHARKCSRRSHPHSRPRD